MLGLSAVHFNFEQLSDPQRILELGLGAAPQLRWSFLLSMFGAYLCLIPLALWLGSTLMRAARPLSQLYTICGLSYLILGAIGAAILAAVWPALMTMYAESPQQHQLILVSFRTATTIAEDGFQGVIQNLAGGIWFAGIGSLLWRQRRPLGGFTIALGLFLLLNTLGNLVEQEALSLIGLTGTILVVPLWSIWIGLVLMRAPFPDGHA